ncbi:uncharacterized protein LOC115668264 [Syzygium oleosum]|uniref:uncharacterized protein LOC115668264 n=1 Tax=Syzygium oleosum TaxID=219896 RepID=UPI0024B8C66C|nr:uncharacterized protein LOC115668264 [Syzygium oleosum]
MEGQEIATTQSSEGSTATAILESLTAAMKQLATQQNPPSSTENSAPTIAIKFNGMNYGLWSQVVEMYVSGKDKLGYLTGDIPQPAQTDPALRKWKIEDATVKGWLINSMEPALIGNFIRFPTAKAVWESVATTYFDGTDTSQVYDLKQQVSRLKQNG